MTRQEVQTFSGKKVFIYDESICTIYYDFDKDVVVIKNKDGVELDRFNKNIYFAEQVESKVLVGEFNEKNKTNPRLSVHYYSFENGTKIWTDHHSITSCVIDSIRFDNGVYILNDDNKYMFYSPKQELFSTNFDSYLTDEDVDFDMKDMILVDEVIGVSSKEERYPIVQDKIRYGIDPDTFKCKTKIYSFNQDKFIDIYTTREILLKGELSNVKGVIVLNGSHYGTFSNDYNLDQTIIDKIIHPLKIQAGEMLKGKKMGTLNYEFIKKIGGKNDN